MKQQSKLRQGEQHEVEAAQVQQSSSQAKEFSSVEEMLRFDAEQHSPPRALAERVNQSVPVEVQSLSWWGRMMQSFRKNPKSNGP